jgi:peroxiredoxin
MEYLENISIYLYIISMNLLFSMSNYSIKHNLNIFIDLSFYFLTKKVGNLNNLKLISR